MRSQVSLAVLAAFLLAGCPKPAETPGDGAPAAATPAEVPVEGGSAAPAGAKVCCESFGYGAMMAKCCETYAWSTADECVVPAGMVGGGREVVDDAKCANTP